MIGTPRKGLQPGRLDALAPGAHAPGWHDDAGRDGLVLQHDGQPGGLRHHVVILGHEIEAASPRRRGHHDRVGAVLARHRGEPGRQVRAGGRDSDRDRHVAGDRLDHPFDDASPLLVGETVRLARDAEDRQPVHPGGEHRLDEPRQALDVEGAVVGERGRQDVKDAGPVDHVAPIVPRSAIVRQAHRRARLSLSQRFRRDDDRQPPSGGLARGQRGASRGVTSAASPARQSARRRSRKRRSGREQGRASAARKWTAARSGRPARSHSAPSAAGSR